MSSWTPSALQLRRDAYRRRRSLRSLLKPWTEERLINALVAAGFEARNVQPFWRNHSFAAFVALR